MRPLSLGDWPGTTDVSWDANFSAVISEAFRPRWSSTADSSISFRPCVFGDGKLRITRDCPKLWNTQKKAHGERGKMFRVFSPEPLKPLEAYFQTYPHHHPQDMGWKRKALERHSQSRPSSHQGRCTANETSAASAKDTCPPPRVKDRLMRCFPNVQTFPGLFQHNKLGERDR